jgi:hypothetical protein
LLRKLPCFGLSLRIENCGFRPRAARLRRDESARALRGSGGTSPPARFRRDIEVIGGW